MEGDSCKSAAGSTVPEQILETTEAAQVKIKPAMPIGTMGVDAFGKHPQFEDKGDRPCAIVNIGARMWGSRA